MQIAMYNLHFNGMPLFKAYWKYCLELFSVITSHITTNSNDDISLPLHKIAMIYSYGYSCSICLHAKVICSMVCAIVC